MASSQPQGAAPTMGTENGSSFGRFSLYSGQSLAKSFTDLAHARDRFSGSSSNLSAFGEFNQFIVIQNLSEKASSYKIIYHDKWMVNHAFIMVNYV